jgi:hypothetical protein
LVRSLESDRSLVVENKLLHMPFKLAATITFV